MIGQHRATHLLSDHYLSLWALPARSASLVSFYARNCWGLEESAGRVLLACIQCSQVPYVASPQNCPFSKRGAFSWLLSSAPFEFDFISDKSCVYLTAWAYSLTVLEGTQFTLHTLSVRYLFPMSFSLRSFHISWTPPSCLALCWVRTGEIKPSTGIALKLLLVHRGDRQLQCCAEWAGILVNTGAPGVPRKDTWSRQWGRSRCKLDVRKKRDWNRRKGWVGVCQSQHLE